MVCMIVLLSLSPLRLGVIARLIDFLGQVGPHGTYVRALGVESETAAFL